MRAMGRKNPKDCRSKDYWLVTTEHLKEGLWFREDDDYKVGMNYVAVLSFLLGVTVLSFTLMSNHVHFVLYCTHDDARLFIDAFKKNCSRFISKKYGIKEALRRNKVDIQRISPDDESFHWAVAYVEMNPVAANICLHPSAYRWGTGRSFFQVSPPKAVRLGTLSINAARRLLHSKQTLPSDWLVGEDGYILPESYVPVKLVESIFKTPRRMNYYLQNSSKAKRRRELQENELPSFRDQVLYAAIPDLCRSLFGKNDASDLNDEQRQELVRQIRRRFSADIHQIVRVTSFSMEDVARFLDAP